MEVYNVPQDDENMTQGKTRELYYVLDDKGNYTTALSTGWEAKNIIFKDVWNDINQKIDETKDLVMKGELSPIAYFMEKNLMDIDLLSDYTNIPKRKIKKHLIPNNFSNLDIETLNLYSNTFNITLDELKNPKF